MTDFLPILETYLSHYKKDSKGFTDMIGKLEVPKQVISSLYELFVYRKELEPIESLDIETKTRLWNKSKGYTGNTKDAVMICKAIYLMEECLK